MSPGKLVVNSAYPFIKLVFVCCACWILSCSSDDNKMLSEEIKKSLITNIAQVWYPCTIDTINGGFLSNFNHKWAPHTYQGKMIVTQARHLWTTSQLSLFLSNDSYKTMAQSGYDFLKSKMWDSAYGGFYTYRNQAGEEPGHDFRNFKSAYGNAFAIYGLSSYYKLTGDTSALNLAKRTFFWLEKHSYDPEYGGYYDQMNREGMNFGNVPEDKLDRRIRMYRWKDYNSSIHLLEAFTELYKIWPDDLLKKRVAEMLTLIRDIMIGGNGYLKLYFEQDWRPVSFRDSTKDMIMKNINLDHITFGHDVETAYLMSEACNTLEHKIDSLTLIKAKKLVDHALENGWDNLHGGLFYQGYYFKGTDTCTIINKEKSWWVQAEALNAFLLMAKLFPKENHYNEAFEKQWEYIKSYLIDYEYGGWYEYGLDQNPEAGERPKAHDWKVSYHDSRALINCIKLLKDEHELLER
ncbi:MAG: AGE family epimerase/isomerase [Calditrichaceae bacterium]|nr:AGE family epimerase/isomerase [Calditrichaceae bacterium]MBN2709474.1 AGE family epimerase/isomerase [Calditrichaceae bacterium]RQV92987.1 MAG: N-acylglucosamine 2-epimerase [Calditrichota bacterium]